MAHHDAAAARNDERVHAKLIWRHSLMNLAADRKAERLWRCRIGVVIGNAKGATRCLRRLSAVHTPLDELAHALADEPRWPAVLKRCYLDLREIYDPYLHDDSPGKVRDCEHRIPDLLVRFLAERTRRHTDRPLERPAECLGTFKAGVECGVQYRMISDGRQAMCRTA